MEKTQISLQKISPQSKTLSGFTLLEILLVIVLLGGLTVAFIPNMTAIFRADSRTTIKKFGRLVKYSYDQAVLTGILHRIVIDMDEQNWRLESADKDTLPIDEAKEKLKGDGKEKLSNPFEEIQSRYISQISDKIQIVKVHTWRMGDDPQKDIKEEGEVYIYIFPSGYIDKSTVTIAEKKLVGIQHIAISIKALTGRLEWEMENIEQ